MTITRREKMEFGKDVNKTLELIGKLDPKIKEAALEMLKGYDKSNPVINTIIEGAVEAISSPNNNTIAATQQPIEALEGGVIAVPINEESKESRKPAPAEALNNLLKSCTVSELEDMVANGDAKSKYITKQENTPSKISEVVANSIAKIFAAAL